MEQLTRQEVTIIKCCLMAEIRMQEEALKEYTGNSDLDKTAREDIGIEIKRLRAIVQKLEA